MENIETTNKTEEEQKNVLLRALLHTGRGFYIWLFICFAGTLWLFFSFWRQFVEGHALTGQGSHGAIWGILVVNIINFIGISHVGIAISAVVRIMNLKRYYQLARLAELVTIAAITTAILNIAMDVGRPERFIINVVWYGRWHSPLVWSATVISTYVIGSIVYLYLAMRADLQKCVQDVPGRKWLYSILALGYQDTMASRQRHRRVVWWLAVIILPIMVSVHSVYGYIFGLQAGRPGWFNPFQAPYFVLGAIVSGFSAIIIILAILRKALGWEDIFYPRIFKGLGIFLGFVTALYMYFLFSEYLTGLYASPHADREVFKALLFGKFAIYTWTMFLGGMVFPFFLLFIQGVNPKICSIKLTVFASILINASLWLSRVLIVVPTFYYPHLPWQMAPYIPTFTEWGLVIGSFFFFGLLYTIMTKILPVLELPEGKPVDSLPSSPIPIWKKAIVSGAFVAGAFLVVLGILLKDQPEIYHSPVIWITGIGVLFSAPLLLCVLPEARRKTSPGADQITKPSSTSLK